MAKEYGWTPQQIDEIDAALLDWLIAIQGIEAEIQEDDRKKQQAQAERARISAQRRRPSRF